MSEQAVHVNSTFKLSSGKCVLGLHNASEGETANRGVGEFLLNLSSVPDPSLLANTSSDVSVAMDTRTKIPSSKRKLEFGTNDRFERVDLRKSCDTDANLSFAENSFSSNSDKPNLNDPTLLQSLTANMTGIVDRMESSILAKLDERCFKLSETSLAMLSMSENLPNHPPSAASVSPSLQQVKLVSDSIISALLPSLQGTITSEIQRAVGDAMQSFSTQIRKDLENALHVHAAKVGAKALTVSLTDVCTVDKSVTPSKLRPVQSAPLPSRISGAGPYGSSASKRGRKCRKLAGPRSRRVIRSNGLKLDIDGATSTQDDVVHAFYACVFCKETYGDAHEHYAICSEFLASRNKRK